jgi:hypothetical protein
MAGENFCNLEQLEVITGLKTGNRKIEHYIKSLKKA